MLKSENMKKPLVYVALDYNTQRENIVFAEELEEKVSKEGYGFKINLDSVLGNFEPGNLTPNCMTKIIQSFEKPVFVDLKMWNGGRTMQNITKGCADLGVDIINMYVHAGENFFKKVLEKLEGTETKLFGLTVLTHYTDEDTQKLYGCSFTEAVAKFARLADNYKAEGIIVPGTQLNTVKRFTKLKKLVPAIRPEWYEDKKDNAQEQIVTPTEAVEGGADYLVIGSPIRNSPDPAEALEKILEEVENAAKR